MTPETNGLISIARTQRRMLVGFLVAMVYLIGVQSLFLAIRAAKGEDLESAYAISQNDTILYAIQLGALLAFLSPGLQLIRRIGWSRLNQVVFVLICLLSTGFGPLLFIALFLVNREATRILRAGNVEVGLLGASQAEIAGLEGPTD